MHELKSVCKRRVEYFSYLHKYNIFCFHACRTCPGFFFLSRTAATHLTTVQAGRLPPERAHADQAADRARTARSHVRALVYAHATNQVGINIGARRDAGVARYTVVSWREPSISTGPRPSGPSRQARGIRQAPA